MPRIRTCARTGCYLLGQIRSALGAVADFSLIEDTVQAEQGDRRVA